MTADAGPFDESRLPVITDAYMADRLGSTKTYSVMLLRAGPNFGTEGAAAIIMEHGRRNFALRADGVLAIVCPVLDESSLMGVGIFDATEEETARIMAGDPGVQAGIFEYEVHPIRSFAGDRLPGDSP